MSRKQIHKEVTQDISDFKKEMIKLNQELSEHDLEIKRLKQEIIVEKNIFLNPESRDYFYMHLFKKQI